MRAGPPCDTVCEDKQSTGTACRVRPPSQCETRPRQSRRNVMQQSSSKCRCCAAPTPLASGRLCQLARAPCGRGTSAALLWQRGPGEGGAVAGSAAVFAAAQRARPPCPAARGRPRGSTDQGPWPRSARQGRSRPVTWASGSVCGGDGPRTRPGRYPTAPVGSRHSRRLDPSPAADAAVRASSLCSNPPHWDSDARPGDDGSRSISGPVAQ